MSPIRFNKLIYQNAVFLNNDNIIKIKLMEKSLLTQLIRFKLKIRAVTDATTYVNQLTLRLYLEELLLYHEML